MTECIKLHCLGCGRSEDYDASIDPNLPASVTRIESNLCDRCDDGGGFGEEHWFDASGKEVAV